MCRVLLVVVVFSRLLILYWFDFDNSFAVWVRAADVDTPLHFHLFQEARRYYTLMAVGAE